MGRPKLNKGTVLDDIEKEILCRLSHGETIKEISFVLKKHDKTIEWHIRQLRERFECRTTIQLIVNCLIAEKLS